MSLGISVVLKEGVFRAIQRLIWVHEAIPITQETLKVVSSESESRGQECRPITGTRNCLPLGTRCPTANNPRLTHGPFQGVGEEHDSAVSI